MNAAVASPGKVWTEAELQALPDDGYLYEVVDGELVMSPKNNFQKDFFSSGTQIVWIVHPDEECVEVCHSLTDRQLVRSGGNLDGESLLPGFSYMVADLFKGWEWD